MYLDVRYIDCFSWMRYVSSHVVKQSRRYKQLGAYNRIILLLYGGGGGGVTAVWAVLFWLTFVI
jgi:hypothetical protein